MMGLFKRPNRRPPRINSLDPTERKELADLETKGTDGRGLDGGESARFKELWRRAGGSELEEDK